MVAKILSFAHERLGEASTWRGIFLCVGAFGFYTFSPGQEHAIEALAIAVFGASHIGPDTVS
jgi:hypothetical protein